MINNTLDLTLLRVMAHTGMETVRKILKNDPKPAVKEPVQQEDDSMYCSCQPPQFVEVEDLDNPLIRTWICSNCDKEAEPYEPEEVTI